MQAFIIIYKSFSVEFQSEIKSMHLFPNLIRNHAHSIWNIKFSNSKKETNHLILEIRKLQPKCSFFIKAFSLRSMFMFHDLFWAVSEIMALLVCSVLCFYVIYLLPNYIFILSCESVWECSLLTPPFARYKMLLKAFIRLQIRWQKQERSHIYPRQKPYECSNEQRKKKNKDFTSHSSSHALCQQLQNGNVHTHTIRFLWVVSEV